MIWAGTVGNTAGQELGRRMYGNQEMKAVTEVAKTTGKALDAVQGLGEFVARFIGGPLEQASGIAEDRLKYSRWERQIRMMKRADEFMKEQGLEMPSRPVPMKVAIPLFQAAFLEEDNDLQDMWARLLVNAGDAESGADVTRAFVDILESFGPLDAQVLQAIYDAPTDVCPGGIVTTTGLPDAYHDLVEGEVPAPSEPVQLALWNLRRLGCIDSAGTWDSIAGIDRVKITVLGETLIRACTLRDKGKN